jgi:hypothetical protein
VPAPPAAEVAPLPVAQPQARVAGVSVVGTPRVPTPVVNATPVETLPPAAAPPKKQAPKKAAAARDDLVAAGGPAVAPVAAVAAPKASGSGFVAVLASKPSRAEAEKVNSDLETKFDVLKGKVFDVQEADLTAQGKGVVFRSVVGPPGSRAFAMGVCNDLKAVGYAGCWATQY